MKGLSLSKLAIIIEEFPLQPIPSWFVDGCNGAVPTDPLLVHNIGPDFCLYPYYHKQNCLVDTSQLIVLNDKWININALLSS